jgi:hypothetical protein
MTTSDAESPYVQPTPPPGAPPPPAQSAGGIPSGEVLRNFVDSVSGKPAPTGLEETTTPAQEAKKEEKFTNATLDKVARFLDPKSIGPLTMLSARHKVFAVKIPTQQEILDVTNVSGVKGLEEPNSAQMQWQIYGELQKAAIGWLPERAQEVQTLRANILDPTKWPPLRKITWLDSRDPHVFTDEVIVLWDQYIAWRTAVVPSREELDFYYANLG